ncbi:MAG: antibiotic biosynthesis monooxygenase family protein [Hyphomicrobiales bacterium]
MIVRIWRGREKKGHAGAYRRHLEGAVFPQLAALPGFMGASLLQRDAGGEAEMLVMTRWASMEAVKAFSGPQPERAVVEPEARAVLASFDEIVTHHEVVSELAAPDGRNRPAGEA